SARGNVSMESRCRILRECCQHRLDDLQAFACFPLAQSQRWQEAKNVSTCWNRQQTRCLQQSGETRGLGFCDVTWKIRQRWREFHAQHQAEPARVCDDVRIPLRQ